MALGVYPNPKSLVGAAEDHFYYNKTESNDKELCRRAKDPSREWSFADLEWRLFETKFLTTFAPTVLMIAKKTGLVNTLINRPL